MMARVLFLCARRSSRSLLAASILAAGARGQYDVWSTPARDAHGSALAEQVLLEQEIPLLSPDHLIEPTFGMRWDEGIIMCSGATNT